MILGVLVEMATLLCLHFDLSRMSNSGGSRSLQQTVTRREDYRSGSNLQDGCHVCPFQEEAPPMPNGEIYEQLDFDTQSIAPQDCVEMDSRSWKLDIDLRSPEHSQLQTGPRYAAYTVSKDGRMLLIFQRDLALQLTGSLFFAKSSLQDPSSVQGAPQIQVSSSHMPSYSSLASYVYEGGNAISGVFSFNRYVENASRSQRNCPDICHSMQ